MVYAQTQNLFKKMISIKLSATLWYKPVNQGTGASGRRYQDITLTVDGLKSVQLRSRWMSNKYITRCHRQFELVGVELVGVRVAVRGNENPLPAEALGPQDSRLSSPADWERSAAIVRGTWGQYVAVWSVSNSPLTHNPFSTLSNKVWEV